MGPDSTSPRCPRFAKLGYPQIPVACVTELGPQLVKKYPQLFFCNGTLTHYCASAIDILKKFHEDRQIGNKVAMVNIADEYGIEISNISKTLFPAAGFEIVYNKSYPLGTQDYSPVIKAAKATNPDAFIAWSYPPDTFGLTEQAKIEDFGVKAYYNGIGVAFPGFAGKFGSSAENVLGFGGTPDNEKTRAFYKLHKEVTGVDADYNASTIYYAQGQVLTQAFESVGSMDREAITNHLKAALIRLFWANTICATSCSTGCTPRVSGRAVGFTPLPASVTPIPTSSRSN